MAYYPGAPGWDPEEAARRERKRERAAQDEWWRKPQPSVPSGPTPGVPGAPTAPEQPQRVTGADGRERGRRVHPAQPWVGAPAPWTLPSPEPYLPTTLQEMEEAGRPVRSGVPSGPTPGVPGAPGQRMARGELGGRPAREQVERAGQTAMQRAMPWLAGEPSEAVKLAGRRIGRQWERVREPREPWALPQAVRRAWARETEAYQAGRAGTVEERALQGLQELGRLAGATWHDVKQLPWVGKRARVTEAALGTALEGLQYPAYEVEAGLGEVGQELPAWAQPTLGAYRHLTPEQQEEVERLAEEMPGWAPKGMRRQRATEAVVTAKRAAVGSPTLRETATERYGEGQAVEQALDELGLMAYSSLEAQVEGLDRLMAGEAIETVVAGREVNTYEPTEEEVQAVRAYAQGVQRREGPEAARQALEQVKATGRIPASSDLLNEVVGQSVLDPLDWVGVGAVDKAARARQAAAAGRFAEAADAVADVGQLATRTDDVADVVRVADVGEETRGMWQRLGDLVQGMNPLAPTERAMATRSADVAYQVAAPLVAEVESADEARALVRTLVQEPERLTEALGAVPVSEAAAEARPLLESVVERLDEMESLEGPFSRAEFLGEFDALLYDAAAEAAGVTDEASGYGKFSDGWRHFWSEFYLRTPGYASRNAGGDLITMAFDGLLSFDGVDEMDDYLARFGPTTRRMAGAAAGQQEVVRGESVLPGVLGRLSEKGGDVIRRQEEGRYKRAFYTALRRFHDDVWAPQAAGAADELVDLVGPERAELLASRWAGAANADEIRQAVDEVMDGGRVVDVGPYLDDPQALSVGTRMEVERRLAEVESLDEVDGVVDEVASEVRGKTGRVLAQDPTPPGRREWSDFEAIQDLREEQGALEALGKRAGVAEEEAARASNALAQQMAPGERRLRQAEEALAAQLGQGMGDRDQVDLMRAVRAETGRDLRETRATVDGLRQRAWEEVEAAREAGRSTGPIWERYYNEVGQVWTQSQARRAARLDEGVEQLKRLQRGETFEAVVGRARKDVVDEALVSLRQMSGEMAARQKRLERLGLEGFVEFDEMLEARRLAIDTSEAEAWRMVSMNPTRDGLDVVNSTSAAVDRAGRAAAQMMEDARDALKAKRINYDAYREMAEQVWGTYFREAAHRWDLARVELAELPLSRRAQQRGLQALGWPGEEAARLTPEEMRGVLGAGVRWDPFLSGPEMPIEEAMRGSLSEVAEVAGLDAQRSADWGPSQWDSLAMTADGLAQEAGAAASEPGRRTRAAWEVVAEAAEERQALLDEGLEVLKEYKQEGYDMVNRALRHDDVPPEAEAIDVLMAQSWMPEDTRVYRGTDFDSLEFSDYTIYPEEADLTGEVFTDKAFVSTTRKRRLASGKYAKRGVLLDIEVPAGTHAIEPEEILFENEQEVLLDRGLQFQVIEDNLDEDQRILKVRVVGETKPEARPTPMARKRILRAEEMVPEEARGSAWATEAFEQRQVYLAEKYRNIEEMAKARAGLLREGVRLGDTVEVPEGAVKVSTRKEGGVWLLDLVDEEKRVMRSYYFDSWGETKRARAAARETIEAGMQGKQAVTAADATVWKGADVIRADRKAAAAGGYMTPPTMADAAGLVEEQELQALERVREMVKADWTAREGLEEATPPVRAQVARYVEEELAPRWTEARATMTDAARQTADFALLDYAGGRKRFDDWLQTVFPYTFWKTRSARNWLIRFMNRPGALAKWTRYQRAMERVNEERGYRTRFEGTIEIPLAFLPEWTGQAAFVDPATFVPWAQLGGPTWTDDPAGADNAVEYAHRVAQRLGLRPYGYIEWPAQYVGWIGQRQEIGYALPHTGMIQAGSVAARQTGLGEEVIPPQGVNIEAAARRGLGLPTQEPWQPYRVNRMLSDMAAERPEQTEALLLAQELQRLVARQELDLNEATGFGEAGVGMSGNVRRLAAELNASEGQMRQAQELLTEAVERAAVERGIGAGTSFMTGMPARIYPAGEREQVGLEREQRAAMYSPLTGTGSRAALEQFRQEHPEAVTRRMARTAMPGLGGGEYEAWTPGEARASAIYERERERIDAAYDELVDAALRESPAGRREVERIEESRQQELQALRARLFGEEEEGEARAYRPRSTYGARPEEARGIRREEVLAAVSEAMPHSEAFRDEETGEVDYEAYERAVKDFFDDLEGEMAGSERLAAVARAQTRDPGARRLIGGVGRPGMPRAPETEAAIPGLTELLEGVTREEVERYWRRNDRPLEAAQRVWEEEVYREAWDLYNRAVERGVDTGEAYERYIEGTGERAATALIDEVMAAYPERWSREELEEALSGVTFPGVAEGQLARMEPEERELSEAQSGFWDFYNEQLPPGRLASGARDHPLVQMLLDAETRGTATAEQYAQALRVLQDWKGENFDREAWGTPEDWARARELNEELQELVEEEFPGIGETLDAYYGLGIAERRAFRREHPEIGRYYDLRDAFGRENPLWAYFYQNRGKYTGGGGYGAGRGYYGGWRRYYRGGYGGWGGGGGGGGYFPRVRARWTLRAPRAWEGALRAEEFERPRRGRRGGGAPWLVETEPRVTPTPWLRTRW